MGFFKDFFDIVIEPTIDDFKDLKQSIKNDNQQFKNDVIDIAKDASPPIGDAFETMDKVGQTIKNKVDASNLSKILVRECNGEAELNEADHLYVQRVFPTAYTHHGLYIGNGEVIHYANGCVNIVDLEEFAGGATINIVESPILYSVDNVIGRAYSRLGEDEYNLIINNCEHFVNWCRAGRKL